MKPKSTRRRTGVRIAPKQNFETEHSEDILDDLIKSLEHSGLDDGNPNYLPRFHSSMLDVAFPEPNGSAQNDSFTLPTSHIQLQAPDNRVPKFEYKEAEEMLRRFERLASQFPFVVLPKTWTTNSMLRERPFLALGIFSVMSNKNLTLQRLLVHKFRRALSESLIVRGERSLDLLQGLLAHLAWYVSIASLHSLLIA